MKDNGKKKPLHPMKPLPADHPIFRQGFIVGQTFSGASPADVRAKRNAMPESEKKTSPSTPAQMTEEQIQAELQRMKEVGYGTAEIAF
ncbi:MAG TPA: hypothetical protein VIY27_07050, partial [Myxococcota bacterium]